MGIATGGEFKRSISTKRSFRPSTSMKHNTAWPISEVSSDLTVKVGETNFSLHKFPLVSWSGKIQKLLLEAKDSKPSWVNLLNVPGGSEGFKLAVKFCYGINIEITLSNVAMLRCVANYLQMTEEVAENNLEIRTEIYLKETVLPSISNSISVLHHCETLLPVADEIKMVSRIINGIADNACKEQLNSGLSKLKHNFTVKSTTNRETETPPNWWGKELTMFNLDFFQRVLSAVRSKGLTQDMISKILINYAHNSLQRLVIRDTQMVKRSFMDAESQKKQRKIVEAMVSLLPTQLRKSSVPTAFLSGLLKAARAVSASASCIADIEKMIGLQLDQAILEDILIPADSNGNNHHPLYETDVILRIFPIFLNSDKDNEEENHMIDESEVRYNLDSPVSSEKSCRFKASKLLDSYLAEVAIDSNLMPSKFIALAELLPENARTEHDGLYRAVDIFLKVHPNIKDSEHYQLCKTIDCQKLSQEACSHAAQNEKLPMHMAVNVLYFEQIRLRKAMNASHSQFFFGSINSQFPQCLISGAGSGVVSPRGNYASVRKENQELKLEVARMRMRLTELEKNHVSIKQELVRSSPAKKILRSFTKRLSKFNALFRIKDDINPIGPKVNFETHFPFVRRRCHSIS